MRVFFILLLQFSSVVSNNTIVNFYIIIVRVERRISMFGRKKQLEPVIMKVQPLVTVEEFLRDHPGYHYSGSLSDFAHENAIIRVSKSFILYSRDRTVGSGSEEIYCDVNTGVKYYHFRDNDALTPVLNADGSIQTFNPAEMDRR